MLSVELAPSDGVGVVAYGPGAHLDVHLPGGLTRQYSLISDMSEKSYRIAVGLARQSRGGSKWFHKIARPGDVVDIAGPRNTFTLGEHPAYFFLAGGIGVTPILSMARDVARRGKRWSMVYAARNRAGAAFADELSALGPCRFHFDDQEGKVCDAAAVIADVPRDTHIYACGPAPMLAAAEAACKAQGRANLHVEYFTPPAGLAEGAGFVVEAARSGICVTVPANASILDALREHGVDAPSSCRQGICGSCETRVLEGVPDHRDKILTDEEKASGRTMMICCSRARTPRLRLDI